MKDPDFSFIENFNKYDPSKNAIIYHYCDLNTFLAIIESRTIRLSDINTMNDFGEMHWAYDRFIDAANMDYSKDDKPFLDACDEVFSNLQTHTLPAVACFSLDGDVLSQWRAYAGDGSGVAIGFDGNSIGKLSVRCARVAYSVPDQVQYFREVLTALKPIWENSKTHDEAHKAFRELAFHSAIDMCLMKNPAFHEEKEVRIIRALTVKRKNEQWYLEDEGGSSTDKTSRRKQKISYRSRDGGIVAYVDLPLSGLGNQVIKEVVIGPKSRNNGIDVSMALSASGFNGFSIRRSKATYR